jgi:hypothetical protein
MPLDDTAARSSIVGRPGGHVFISASGATEGLGTDPQFCGPRTSKSATSWISPTLSSPYSVSIRRIFKGRKSRRKVHCVECHTLVSLRARRAVAAMHAWPRVTGRQGATGNCRASHCGKESGWFGLYCRARALSGAGRGFFLAPGLELEGLNCQATNVLASAWNVCSCRWGLRPWWRRC